MNIRIQVLANQARQAIQQVQGDITRMNAVVAASNAATGTMGSGLNNASRGMARMGSQVQWAGRQLQYNFTLPLLAAGAAGTKFALDNEREMTRLVKVYGDGAMASQQVKSETDALARSFEVMSERYGIARKDVIGIAADWAAAGASGVALAKATDLTMKTMVLGEMDAAASTEALIAIQAQYNFSTDELADTIAKLNAVENQTGTNMQDLITAMSKSAGVARDAGIDVAHLAAMTSALVPAAGSAAQAGNAMMTIISRLLSPTASAVDVLQEMGIATSDLAWKSADGASRLQLLSEKYEGLDDAQQAVVSSTLASNYQINKFGVLMDAIAMKGDAAGNGMSYYWKALDATSDRTKYLKIMTDELNTVLDSQPKKFDRIKVILQNSLADAMQQLLPVIIYVGQQIAGMAKSFSNLNPSVQKIILAFLLLFAVIGPIMSRIGAMMTLVGYAGLAFSRLAGFVLAPIGLLGRFAKTLRIAGTAAGSGAFSALGFVFGGLVGQIKRLGPAFRSAGVMLVNLVKYAFVFSTTFIRALGLPAILAIWRYMWTMMLLVTGIAMSSLSRAVAFGMGVLPRIIATVVPLMVGALSAIGPLLGTALLNAFGLIAAVMMPAANGLVIAASRIGFLVSEAFYGSLVVAMTLWQRFVGLLRIAMFASGPILTSAMSMVGAALVAAWNTALFAVTYVTTIWGPRLVAATTAAMSALGSVFSAVGAGIAAAWSAVGRGLVALQWAIMRGLAVATSVGGTVVTAAVAAAGRAVTLTWALITRAMPIIWAANWAAIRAITSFSLTNIVKLIASRGAAILAAMTGPWGIAAIAVITLLIAFHDKLGGIWNSIVQFLQGAVNNVIKAFWKLPEGIQQGMIAAVNVVKNAALQVYEWFSYLNPFAHHSPSLVENVTNGMAEVNKQYGTITNIKGPIDSAYASIKRFKAASADLAKGYDSIKTAKEVADLTDAGASQGVIDSYVDLAGRIATLKVQQDRLGDAVTDQEAVVKSWQRALQSANDTLDAQKDKLSDLEAVAQSYADKISDAEGRLSDFASAPIQGMRAMDDAIFSNEQSQKRLQLQMALMAKNGGASYDELTNKIADLNGQIELLGGAKADLRSMGAGSEITGVYDDQIKALQGQKKALNGQVSSTKALNDELDKLQADANILDLQKSLQFDGLTRQIQQAADGMKELPFSTIMSGIASTKGEIAGLTTQYNAANAAVDRQKSAVDAAQASVDSIQASYDAQQAKLDGLKASYDEITQAVQDMSAAMQDASAAASALNQAKADAKQAEEYVSPALQNFRDAEGGNFADVGGTGMIGREGGEGDQSADIDAYTKTLTDGMGDLFGSFDMFEPIKKYWGIFKTWWDTNVWPYFQAAGTLISAAFGDVDWGGIAGTIGGWFSNIFGGVDWGAQVGKAWTLIKNFFGTIWDIGKMLWDLLGPGITGIADMLVDFFGKMFVNLKTVWDDAKTMVGPFMDALNNLWNIAKPFVMFIAGEFITMFMFALNLIKNVAKPILDLIASTFMNVWHVIKGILDIFIGIMTGDWARVWNGLKGIVGAVLSEVIDIVKAAFGLIIAPFYSFIETIVTLGKYLWDGFINGVSAGAKAVWDWFSGWVGSLWDFIKGLFGVHSPSTIFAEIGVFLLQGLIDGLTSMGQAVLNFFSGLIDGIGAVFSWLWDKAIKPVLGWVKEGWDGLGSALKAVYDTVIKPVWDAAGAAIAFLWEKVVKPNIDFWTGAWETLGKGLKWVYDEVIKPMFDAAGTAIAFLWEKVVKPNIDFWSGAWDALGKGLKKVYDDVIKPMWDAAGTAIAWLWEKVVKPNIDFWSGAWSALGTGLKWVWENVIKVAWDALGTAFQWLWDHTLSPLFSSIGSVWSTLGTGLKSVYDSIIKPMFDAFGTVVSGLSSIFGTAASGIGTAWNAVKSAAGTPINFVIGTVLNRGLFAAFNKIVETLHLPFGRIDDFPEVKLAGGGRVPGYSPNSKADNIPAMLTANEYVQPVDSTRHYGVRIMDAIRAKRIPKDVLQNYANGGLVDFGRELQRMGAKVTEHPAFGGVAMGGHGKTSLHYTGHAFDVNTQPGTSLLEQSQLRPLMALARSRGFRTIFMAPDHYNHGHVDDGGGKSMGEGNGTPSLAGSGGDSGGGLLGGIWDSITGVLDSLKNSVSGPINKLTSDFGDNPMTKILSQIPGKGISMIWDAVSGKVTDIAHGLWNGAKDLASSGWDMATGSVGGAWDLITNGGGMTKLKEAAKSLLQTSGFGGDANWNAFDYVVSHESGWKKDAQNGTSTASGLGQMINGTWMANRGTSKATRMRDATEVEQLNATIKYMKGRFGSPVGAADYWKAHHNYADGGQVKVFDKGGMMDGLGMNKSGRPERVLDPRQTVSFEKLVEVLGRVDFDRLDARMNASAASQQSVVYNNSGDTNINITFTGDLTFPNVKNGDDAEDLLQNLADMAGSGR